MNAQYVALITPNGWSVYAVITDNTYGDKRVRLKNWPTKKMADKHVRELYKLVL